MSRLDRSLLIIVALLTIAGLLLLYSAGQVDVPSNGKSAWIKQLYFLPIAILAAAAVYRVSYRLVEWAATPLYGLGLTLLAVTLVAGTGAARTAASSKSWLGVGPARFQPVEIVKVATILMLARWFVSRREPPGTLRGLIPPIAIASVPALLVLKQPDLGSAIVFAGVLFAMLFWAGVAPSLLVLLASPVVSLLLAFSTPLWSAWMVLLFVLLVVWRPYIWEGVGVYVANSVLGIVAPIAWGHMSAYQKDRLLSFLDPAAHASGPAYQAVQSMMAIGSGGWFGNGYTAGPQKRGGFIPEWWSDFVFVIVGEEFGFIGVLVSLVLFLALLYTLVRIARRAADPFASLVVFGIAGLIFTHVFENIGMTVSVMPITGIPLPFFSAGGSFMVVIFATLGLAFRAAGEQRSSGYVDSSQ